MSAEKLGGLVNLKKKRSLDLQTLYQSDGDNKGRSDSKGKREEEKEGNETRKKRKRKGVKEVALTRLELVEKNSSRADDEGVNGVNAGSVELQQLCSGFVNRWNKISYGFLGDNGDPIPIPKRPRKVLGCKNSKNQSVSQSPRMQSSSEKLEDAHLPKKPGLSGNEASAGSGDRMVKSSKASVGNVVDKLKQKVGVDESKGSKKNHLPKKPGLSGSETSAGDKISKLGKASSGNANGKIKSKVGVEESKGSKNGRDTSAQHTMMEDAHTTVKNADASSKKCRSTHRKRKDPPSSIGDSVKNAEPPGDNASRYCDDFQDDDDEENLEQNAARMLSSRFDPRCTGFASKSKASVLSSANQVSSFISSSKDLTSRDANSLASPMRKDNKEKGAPRKRRHFYEVLLKDLDVYWVLNKRIQVFCPLDETWCCGLLKDYDPEKRLHQVKYDGRDEVWINLENERFKLLLFPSEVPGKDKPRRSAKGSRSVQEDKIDLDIDEDSHSGSYLESEPIISWLAHRVKSSSRPLKKQKTSELSSSILSSPSHDQSEDTKDSIGSLDRFGKKPECGPPLLNLVTDEEKARKSFIGSHWDSENKKPVVYVRRRFRKKDIGHSLSENDTECGRMVLAASTVDELTPQSEVASLQGSDNEFLLWSLDEEGLLSLSLPFVESKQFTFDIHLPTLSFLQHDAEYIWLSHTLLLLQYGAIVKKWPEVILEMLFVDNTVGLRFLLFECCLKEAMVLAFIVMALFSPPGEHWELEDTQLPVTSVRFKFSRVQDLKKQKVFVFYSFSKLESSKWLYLDSKLRYHSLLAKRLSLSECTYENIKSLECPSHQFSAHNHQQSPSSENLQRKSVLCSLATGISKDSRHVRMSLPASSSDSKLGQVLPFALSFAAAPALFVSLHLHLLMERNFACLSLQNHDPPCSVVSSDITGQRATPDASLGMKCYENVLDTTSEDNVEPLLPVATSTDIDGLEKNASELVVSQIKSGASDQQSYPVVVSPQSGLDHISIEIPSSDHIDRPSDGKEPFSRCASDLTSNVSDGIPQSPNHIGPRSSVHRNRNNSLSSPVGELSPVWSDGKTGFIRSGFVSGPKKPRTQVHYTLPYGGYDSGSRHKIQGQKTLPCKRIRRASEKKISDSGRSSQRNIELLACDANILVTIGDKGWRENGARVVLEVADHNEWRLAIKLSGSTKYSYKVHNILQPGSTNRFTHAMMWKGGKDWVLEFPDRSQWTLFKEMYEECHNRNIRAALIKNIPIPGVRLIEEMEDNATYVPFARNFSNYFHQIESDIDMAMNTSRILYDMDSDDECWLSTNQTSSDSSGNEISDELFEKTMDMLEKVAYAEQRENFTSEELEEFMAGVAVMEVVKSIYEHWKLKRQKMGMPLVRHLQRPLWERYQQQVKDWELAVSRAAAVNHGKAPPIEKPPMFAFCLKPRGLDIPSRGSKQRSQKKISVSGNNHTVIRDQDGFHAYGRRINGYALGDEMVVYAGNNHESLDASPPFYASRRVFSPREAGVGYFSLNNDGFEWNHHPKFQRNKSKRIGTFMPSSNGHLVGSYDRRTIKRNGVHQWNMGLSDWPSSKLDHLEGTYRHNMGQFDIPNVQEFRLRDASSAAKHAFTVAKQKREKAQRLLYMADVAIHKAVVALMNVDAMKASTESANGNG
nr:Histone-lysine N-methyltransferase [Ipomoea batatas]